MAERSLDWNEIIVKEEVVVTEEPVTETETVSDTVTSERVDTEDLHRTRTHRGS